MEDFTNQLALITGATGGIGYQTAISLAARGCNVAVHYNSAKEDADKLVDLLQRQNVNALPFQADLSNYDEVCTLCSSRCYSTTCNGQR